MTSGFGWGRFFLPICLSSAGVCLPLGQPLGAEQAAETRLVYLELAGEPAAEVAARLSAQGLAAGEIAKATAFVLPKLQPSRTRSWPGLAKSEAWSRHGLAAWSTR
jgi:hypothetical protein